LTSIERTAYPQFRRLTTARVLHVFFTPTEDEAAWARERTESPEALLALVVDLKCFQKMARFCSREEIPQAVTDHVRHCLGLAPETEPGHGAARTAKWHRGQVRKRQGVTYDMGRARVLAEAAIREAAQVRNHPPDLINPVVALNRAVAITERDGPEHGLAALEAIVGMERSQLWHAALADNLRRLGRAAEAAGELETAAALAPTEGERRLLLSRLLDVRPEPA
jgi:Domain of unknown function (DUF4158)